MKGTIILPHISEGMSDLSIRSNDSQCFFLKIGENEIAILKDDLLKSIQLLSECKNE